MLERGDHYDPVFAFSIACSAIVGEGIAQEVAGRWRSYHEGKVKKWPRSATVVKSS